MTGQTDSGEAEPPVSDGGPVSNGGRDNPHGGGAGPSPDARHQAGVALKVGIATAIVGLIAAIPAYYALFSGTDDTKPSAEALPSASSGDTQTDAPTSSATTSAEESPPASEPSSGQHGTGSASTPAGDERWRGRLVLDSSPKDLDAGQPVEVGYSDEGDVFLVGEEIGGWNGTVISLWSGRTTSPPDFAACSNTVHAEGSDGQELETNMVMCVRTSSGNIARLKLTEFEAGTDARAVFDTVVWSAS